jgi:hypothetical protein
MTGLGRRLAGVRGRLFIGALLAVTVYAGGCFKSGRDGPCWYEPSFVGEHPEAADFRVEYPVLPPRQRCVALDSRGTVIAARTYPEPETYLLAAALFALPFAMTPLGRALRSRRR